MKMKMITIEFPMCALEEVWIGFKEELVVAINGILNG
jgi:hypothetical protein